MAAKINTCANWAPAALAAQRKLGYFAGTVLLSFSVESPHATLIILFYHAVTETLINGESAPILTWGTEPCERIEKYAALAQYDPRLIKFLSAMELVNNWESVFQQYTSKLNIPKSGEAFAVMKENHTVVARWPLALKLPADDPGAEGELERLLADTMSSQSRYVEWKRVQRNDIERVLSVAEALSALRRGDEDCLSKEGFLVDFEDYQTIPLIKDLTSMTKIPEPNQPSNRSNAALKTPTLSYPSFPTKNTSPNTRIPRASARHAV
ncbi:hypothetical protein BJX76DRAFT_355152 [Aspergillus varians]